MMSSFEGFETVQRSIPVINEKQTFVVHLDRRLDGFTGARSMNEAGFPSIRALDDELPLLGQAFALYSCGAGSSRLPGMPTSILKSLRIARVAVGMLSVATSQ